jgi:hypothetical protein
VSWQVVTHTPEQQSECAEHATPVSRQGKSQKPPEQNPEQHSVLDEQLLPDCVHDAGAAPPSPTGPHLPPEQLKLQHSAGCPQCSPSARHVS